MNKHYKTDYVDDSGKTLLQTVLDALPRVDVLDDGANVIGTRPQWESVSSHGSHNIQATNKGIVEVIADDDVLALLDADPRFTDAGNPFAVDKDGEPDEVKRAEYQTTLKTARSTERQRKHKVQKQVDGVDKTIAKTETIIARKEVFRAKREQSRKNLVVIKRDLLDMRGGTFVGNVESVITEIEAVYTKIENFRVNMTSDDELIIVRYAKTEILDGIRKGVKADISTIIQAENGLNVRIDNHVKARDKLIGDIADEQFHIDGAVEGGQNLTQRKAELTMKLERFPQ